MRKLATMFKARPLLAVMLVVVSVLVLVGATYAAVLFTLSVPSSGTIVDFAPPSGGGGGSGDPSYTIAVYEGTSATDPRLNNTASPGVAWGNITRGDPAGVLRSFFVVNIGNQPVVVSAGVTMPAGLTAVVGVGSGTTPVPPGGNTTVTITLKASTSATVGVLASAFTNFYAGSP